MSEASNDCYAICTELTGRCACREHRSGPCDAILLIALNGGADDERERIEGERREAAVEAVEADSP